MSNTLESVSGLFNPRLGASALDAMPTDAEVFTTFARMAADCMDVPLAAVAVADGERLRFLGEIGFGITETPLSASLLMPHFRAGQPLTVLDMSRDARFSAHPLVAGAPALRFAAAVPLAGSDGRVFGFVAGLDTAPHLEGPTETQAQMLQGLASLLLACLAAQGRGRETERALQEARRCLEAISSQALVGILHQDFNGRILMVNERFCALAGRSAKVLRRVPLERLMHLRDWRKLRELFDMNRPTGQPFSTEVRWARPDGSMLWCAVDVSFVRDETGKPVSLVAFMHDITWYKKAKAALNSSEERFRLATKAARLGVADYHLPTGAFSWSDELRAMVGAPEGTKPSLRLALAVLEPEARRTVRNWLLKPDPNVPLREGAHYIRIRRLDNGALRWLEVRVWASAADDGESGRLVLTTRDVTEEKNSEERVLWASEHDPLTGLANRRLFLKRLSAAVQQAETERSHVGLLLFDLDKLKQTNDTLGHEAGDFLLRTFVERLQGLRREEDTLARLGGDEFALIMPNLSGSQQMLDLAQTVLEQMRERLTFEGHAIECRASIGASLYPEHGRDANNLQRNADVALYRAKAQGRCRLVVFEPEMRSELQLHTSMLSMARQALDTGNIVPYFQPKIALDTGKLVGFEALLRWRHPRRGIQGPAQIAAALEDQDLAVAISERMFALVAAQMRAWLDAGYEFGHVAVNASAVEFLRDNFAERVLGQLQEAGVPPRYLELEVTESVLLGHQSDRSDRILRTLSNAGVRIALDDFGTGFASLSHLKRFPVDTIKIDQSFVRDLENDPFGGAIIRAVISLGQSLGICVVAEGIETQAQADFLLAHQCDVGQGYFLGRPAAALAAENLLQGVYAA